MPSEPQLLRRSPYLIPPSTELAHSVRTHYEDWEHYHLPLARMHHASLHDWGVASGLDVQVHATAPTEIEVKPGVAIDAAGELIALSRSGKADIGGDQLIDAPFRLSTQGISNALHYLVIMFGERLNFTEQKHEQLPKLRLVPTSGDEGYIHDGSSIILAIVQTDADGKATILNQKSDLAHGRRQLGSHAEQLELRRSSLATTNTAEETTSTVGATVAGRVAAHDSGLRITVPDTGDSVAFTREDGGVFNQLGVNAQQVNFQGDLHVEGASSLKGNVGIGITIPRAKLDVNGDLQLLNGVAVNEFSTDSTLADSRHTAIPTERAVKEYVDNLLIGCVAAFATPTPPPGWLLCNGQAISRTQFARLFARIGTTFGQGNGSTTFNVPDLRGLMIRGWDQGSGRDSGRVFGTFQADGFQDHRHSFHGNFATIGGGSHSHVIHTNRFWRDLKLSGGGSSTAMQFNENARSWAESHTHGYTPTGSVSDATTGNRTTETRTKNLALLYCIMF